MSDTCGLLCEYKDTLKMLAALIQLFEEMHLTHCSGQGKHYCTLGWPQPWVVRLVINAQLEAEAPVRKLENKLRLEKDSWLFPTLPDSGQANKVGERDNKLETLPCHFAKLEGHRLLQNKIENL